MFKMFWLVFEVIHSIISPKQYPFHNQADFAHTSRFCTWRCFDIFYSNFLLAESPAELVALYQNKFPWLQVFLKTINKFTLGIFSLDSFLFFLSLLFSFFSILWQLPCTNLFIYNPPVFYLTLFQHFFRTCWIFYLDRYLCHAPCFCGQKLI